MSPRRNGPTRPLLIIALVLLGHALLWLLLSAQPRPKPHGTADRRLITLRVIAVKAQPPLMTPAPSTPPAARSASARSVVPHAKASIEGRAEIAPAADTAPLPSEAIAAASSPASAGAITSLLDSEATRRVLRQAAREPLLSERAAAATQAPGIETAQQRLGREIGQSATGECLKGEFAGGGMGLLSLPFWLLAEARGKCRR